MTETLLEPIEVLEFLDHAAGRQELAELQRRGIPAAMVQALAGQGFVELADGAVQLTDEGAACLGFDPTPRKRLEAAMADPTPAVDPEPEPVPIAPAPPAEPKEREMNVEELRASQRAANGNGSVGERLVALIAEHPDGLRPARMAEMLGVNRTYVNKLCRGLVDEGELDAVPLGSNPKAGILYFIAGEAKVPPAPDLKATTKPKRTKAVSRTPRRSPAQAEQVKPPPSDPGDLDRYLGLLGRLVSIEPPGKDVLDRMEAMLELDAKVRS